MLQIMYEVEKNLASLLSNPSNWKSVDINYHPPRVERLWMQHGEYRISLHCIHSCTTEEALLHPHPWPSAMRIIQGKYEMGVGYSTTNELPPIAAKIILCVPSEYEMTDPNGWHYVRPTGKCVYTLMITGTPWERDSPKSSEPLVPLSEERKEEIIKVFRERYTNWFSRSKKSCL